MMRKMGALRQHLGPMGIPSFNGNGSAGGGGGASGGGGGGGGSDPFGGDMLGEDDIGDVGPFGGFGGYGGFGGSTGPGGWGGSINDVVGSIADAFSGMPGFGGLGGVVGGITGLGEIAGNIARDYGMDVSTPTAAVADDPTTSRNEMNDPSAFGGGAQGNAGGPGSEQYIAHILRRMMSSGQPIPGASDMPAGGFIPGMRSPGSHMLPPAAGQFQPIPPRMPDQQFIRRMSNTGGSPAQARGALAQYNRRFVDNSR